MEDQKKININQLNDKDVKTIFAEFEKQFSKDLDGLPFAYCFKDIYCSLIGEQNQVHTRAQHGEEKAFESCSKKDTIGGTLFTTSSSCELCAKKALNYGISRIVYIEPYTGIANSHILGFKQNNTGQNYMQSTSNANPMIHNEPMKIELFTGATQCAYVQLYNPLFPLKDEMELRGVKIPPRNIRP